MPINQFIPTQAPGLAQTPTGAGLGAYSQAISNAFAPQMMRSQIFGQEMSPLSLMALSPGMWSSKGFANMFGKGIANAMNQLYGTNMPAPQFPLQSAVATGISKTAQAVEHAPSFLAGVVNAVKNILPVTTPTTGQVTSTDTQQGSLMPSQSELSKNAPDYSFLYSNISPEEKAQRVTNFAQQEYDAEHGVGAWGKASPQARKQQWDSIYNDMKSAYKHPYGS